MAMTGASETSASRLVSFAGIFSASSNPAPIVYSSMAAILNSTQGTAHEQLAFASRQHDHRGKHLRVAARCDPAGKLPLGALRQLHPAGRRHRLSRPFLRAIDVVAHRRLEVDLDDRLRVRRDHPLTAAIALQPQQIGEEAPIEDRWVPSMVAVARDDDPPWRKC